MTARDLYVYGIVRAGHRLPPGSLGVGSPPAPVRGLPAGRLAAVVSDVPEGLRARRRDLMAHQGLLTSLAATGAVVPMRFGTVCGGEDVLVERLAAAERHHLTCLDRIDGRVEMNLKVLPAQEDGLADLLRDDAHVRRLRDDARRRPGYEANLRLGEAVTAGLERRAREAAAHLLRELSAFADGTAAGPEVAGCVLNTSFLVGGSEHDRFTAAVSRLAAGHRGRVELKLTGPMPCYSFVGPEHAPAGA
ncbi:GvpL/GvpF family gas vesicle protein [Streptomyces sp. Tu 2975]|uniref:GvpL/GvpF family gas vesicle protein n=1 Tax=Streptomyces sp. Tu 2975 TaxID=2676871 RepID=UPI00135B6776|nr:GvpL/GvpF family gas vesicle protein [Streptomyces sp. Tu 2975]QIP83611.1 GvpL/GvpF family gas vesicle protein [Streptomyces sp. Tu 2975]